MKHTSLPSHDSCDIPPCTVSQLDTSDVTILTHCYISQKSPCRHLISPGSECTTSSWNLLTNTL